MAHSLIVFVAVTMKRGRSRRRQTPPTSKTFSPFPTQPSVDEIRYNFDAYEGAVYNSLIDKFRCLIAHHSWAVRPEKIAKCL